MIGALDIGGTKIAAGIVTSTGDVLAQRQSATVPERGFDDALERMIRMLVELQSSSGERLKGIGIGCTGPVDPQTGVIGSAELLHGWNGAPITDRLAEAFGVPVAMENDADAVALAESAWGSGRGAECMVYVTIGTGIGGGIVRKGELYRGAEGAHPEIGHMAVDVTHGPKCYCGLTGCWESLASGPAMEAWYSARGGPASASEICRRAVARQPLAVEAVQRTARYIGLGLVNVVTAYCPDVLILGGGVVRSSSLFLEDVWGMVLQLATQVPSAHLQLTTVEGGETTGVRGAAAAWLHRNGGIRRT